METEYKFRDAFQKFDYQTSIDFHTSYRPEGALFEEHVQNLFSPGIFKLLEKNSPAGPGPEQNTAKRKNFDLIFEYIPTREKFAVVCKYPVKPNKRGQLEWSDSETMRQYQEFERSRKIPLYIILGYDKVTKEWDRYTREYYKKTEKIMYNIPLKEARYTSLYSNIYSDFERNYHGKFFWNKGVLY